jgi:hypothetical protein
LGFAMAAPGKRSSLLSMVVIRVQRPGPAAAGGQERRLILPASSDAGGWRITSRGGGWATAESAITSRGGASRNE